MESDGSKQPSYLRVCDRVAIVGATHGNEVTGLQLLRYLENNPEELGRSTFSCKTVLGNPLAIKKRARFVDCDLNRCFLKTELQTKVNSVKYERQRAQYINQLLGPKGMDTPNRYDMIFDLHNTTANTGILLLFHRSDILSLQIAEYLSKLYSNVRVCLWRDQDQPLLPTVAYSGMTVEVGPVAHGCINSKLYLETKNVISSALDFIEQHNKAFQQNKSPSPPKELSLKVFQRAGNPIMFDTCKSGLFKTMIHPDFEGKDWIELNEGDPIMISAEGKTITWQKTNCDFSPAFPFFINEAAYYGLGIAFVLASMEDVHFPRHW